MHPRRGRTGCLSVVTCILRKAREAWCWIHPARQNTGDCGTGKREASLTGLIIFLGSSYRNGLLLPDHECWVPAAKGPVFFGLDDFRFGKPAWRLPGVEQQWAPVITLSQIPTPSRKRKNFVGHLCLSGIPWRTVSHAPRWEHFTLPDLRKPIVQRLAFADDQTLPHFSRYRRIRFRILPKTPTLPRRIHQNSTAARKTSVFMSISINGRQNK